MRRSVWERTRGVYDPWEKVRIELLKIGVPEEMANWIAEDKGEDFEEETKELPPKMRRRVYDIIQGFRVNEAMVENPETYRDWESKQILKEEVMQKPMPNVCPRCKGELESYPDMAGETMLYCPKCDEIVWEDGAGAIRRVI